MSTDRYKPHVGVMGSSLRDPSSLELAMTTQEAYLAFRHQLLEEDGDDRIVMIWLLDELEIEALVEALRDTPDARLRVLAEQWEMALASRDKYLAENPE